MTELTSAMIDFVGGDPTARDALEELLKNMAINNPIDSNLSAIDINHQAGQGGASPIAVAVHDYTDSSKTLQLDKVGGDQVNQDYILGLRRANNPTRRVDKDGAYVGDAGFIQATYDTWTATANFTGSITGDVLTVSAFSGTALAVGQRITGAGVAEDTKISAFLAGSGGNGTYAITVRSATQAQFLSDRAMVSNTKGSEQAILINKTGGISWPVQPGILSSSKADATAGYALQLIAALETQDLVSLSGYRDSVAAIQSALTIQTDLSGGRVVFATPSVKASGMRFTTGAGPIALAPLASANGVLNPVQIGNASQLTGSLTVAQLATYNATTYAGSIVRCSNGNAGAACLAIAEGGSWLRVPLGAAVSAS